VLISEVKANTIQTTSRLNPAAVAPALKRLKSIVTATQRVYIDMSIGGLLICQLIYRPIGNPCPL